MLHSVLLTDKIQPFCSVCSVEPFGKGILRWFTRPDKFQHHTILFCPLCQQQRHQLRTVTHPTFSGHPRFAKIMSSILTPCCAEIFRSISIASFLCLKSQRISKHDPKPLTLQMLIESAKAGRWLYDLKEA